jgi:hypothetical protein
LLNEKHVEAMLDYVLAHGTDELAVRLDFALVLGPNKLKIFALEGDPALLKATFNDFESKWAEAKAGLQKIVDDQNKVVTTQAR